MLKRHRVTQIIILLVLVLAYASQSFAAYPDILFFTKTEKKIKQIYLVGETEDHILMTNRSHIYVYDSNTGALVWEAKVPKFEDEGMDLIWNEEYYITSTKKGLICYNMKTGDIVWQAESPIKMKKYQTYYNFHSGFVLDFGETLVGFDPNDGSVKWQSEELDWNKKFIENGVPVIYSKTCPDGPRFVVIGKKLLQVVDASNGQTLNSFEMEFHWKMGEPIEYVGDKGVMVFGKEATKYVSLSDGKVVWEREERTERKYGEMVFEHKGKYYGFFAYKKTLVLYDMETGEMLWDTGEDLAVEPDATHIYDDDTMVIVGCKNNHKPSDIGPRGGYTYAYGLDFNTGEVKYQTLVGYSTEPSLNMTIPIIKIEIGYRQSLAYCDFENERGLMIYYYGNKGRKIGDPGDKKWDEPGGEGLILIDPKTGEVKWRTELVLYESWEKEINKARAYKEALPQVDIYNLIVPFYKYTENDAFISCENTVVRVNLDTGEIVWKGPELGYVSELEVADNVVFGKIGYSAWSFSADTGKEKADDQIQKSKNNGYFSLDANTGKEIWKVTDTKVPPTLFANHWIPGQGILLCDGEELMMLDHMKGGYKWDINLKKELTGEIGAKKGVVFVLTGVTKSTSHGVNTITTTTTKSYEVSMEHGVFPMEDGNFLVIGEKGPALVGLDGKTIWSKEWKWKNNKINFTPTVTYRGILYQYKKKLQYISLKDGSVIWESKESPAADVDMFFNSDKTKMFIVGKKYITCYKM